MTATVDTGELLTTEQAAEYLHMTPGTLRVYRSQNRGPNFQRTGSGGVRYRRADLENFLKDVETASTAYARAAVAVTDALGRINGTDLDALMTQLRTATADDKADRPAMSVLWDRLARLVLLEYVRRERKLPDKPAAVTAEGPSPYL